MDIQRFKNSKGVIILVCAILIVLIYSVDIFKLVYRMTAWQQFGDIPVEVGEIQYFVPDIPQVIGYKEAGGEMISCAQAVAYVKTTTQETYRCCNTGERISCLAGDFSNEIPAAVQDCTTDMRSLFGVPDVLQNTQDYDVYETCSSGSSYGPKSLTVAQLTTNGKLLWKFVDANKVEVLNSTIKCALAPLLLLSIGILFLTSYRQNREPVRRF